MRFYLLSMGSFGDGLDVYWTLASLGAKLMPKLRSSSSSAINKVRSGLVFEIDLLKVCISIC